MARHVHAELIMQYATELAESGVCQIKNWEFRNKGGDQIWEQCSTAPEWRGRLEYRRKPRTIVINGFEVPEPVREELCRGDVYYLPDFSYNKDKRFAVCTWSDHHWDYSRLKAGVIHLTKEAAEIHAKALLSFTEKKE